MNARPRIGLLWARFSACHADRLAAVTARLADRAEIVAVEVASRSHTSAWEPSSPIAGARTVRLLGAGPVEDVAWWRRLWAQLRALRRCDVVFVGLPHGDGDAIVLPWLLRLCGVQPIMMSASKWDDAPRRIWHELGKAIALLPYRAAVVGGARQRAYARFLGFSRRPVLCGYNTVSVDRVRCQAAAHLAGADPPRFAERPFIYVGRFVPNKQLELVLGGYARYAAAAGAQARRLVLIGSGDLEPALRAQAQALGVAHLIEWPGFLGSEAVAGRLAGACALILASRDEQWGLVVNEAAALGIPVIASAQIGAREALVGNFESGWVVHPVTAETIAAAMAGLGSSEAGWAALSAGMSARAWCGDAERFADAVEVLCFPDACAAARERSASFEAAIIPPLSGDPL